jgi:hypothetical protein
VVFARVGHPEDSPIQSFALRWGEQEFEWEDIARLVCLLREETESEIAIRIFAGQGRDRISPLWCSFSRSGRRLEVYL